ncbi:MAG: hypothetical protein ACE37H_10720 [Phycisphaeraceae bacterium]
MRVRDRWYSLGLIALLLIGCEPKGRDVDPETRVPLPGPAVGESGLPDWFPHAVDVRVHPASRYVKERDDLRLEARIELIDQFNEPVKDVGRVVVELRLLDANGKIILDQEGRQRGFRWAFDLTTELTQRELWDPIARAYVLPLKIGEADADFPEFRTVLRVTFDPVWPGMPTLPTGERKAVEVRTDW